LAALIEKAPVMTQEGDNGEQISSTGSAVPEEETAQLPSQSAGVCRLMTLVVATFPDIDRLASNPYWVILRSALRDTGVSFAPEVSQFGRRWLWASRSSVNVLHFHYVQQFYAYEGTKARLRWVLRFARNLMLARLWGYRTVFTLHNLQPTYPLFPRWVDYLGHWVAANLTHSVIVHCEYARSALAAYFGRHRNVHLVPHPHFVGLYANVISVQDARIRLGLGPREKVFLFFGGIRPNKGLKSLIKAFIQMPDEDWRLIIAGKPWPPADYLHALMELGKQDKRIRFFARFIPDEDAQVFMNAADVVVLPFASILTSGSAVLAMSFGRPLVVPAMGCLPELVSGDVGLLYDPCEPRSLQAALECCINRDLQHMGVRALHKVQQFTWEEVATRTLSAYQG